MLRTGLEDRSQPFPAAHLHLLLLQSTHICSKPLVDLIENVKLPHLPEALLPAPGLLVWSTSSIDVLRHFAHNQLQHSAQLQLEHLQDAIIPWHASLAYFMRQLSSRHSSGGPSEFEEFHIFTSSDATTLWTSLLNVLVKLDKQLVLRASFGAVQMAQDPGARCSEMVRVVCTHLGDTGQHWLAVLHSFIGLLEKCGPDIWGNEGPAYSGIVMHAILDNAQLEANMQQGHNVFGWTTAFIESIKETSLVQPHLSAILNILLVRLQLPRFELSARTTGARAALRLLLKVFVTDSKHSPLPPRMQSIKADLLDVQSSFLSRLCFAQPYACLLTSNRPVSSAEQEQRIEDHRAWSKISTEARRLMAELLAQDSRALAQYQIDLAMYFKSSSRESVANTEVPRIKLCKSAWVSCYDAIRSSKQNQAASFAGAMLRAYAPVAHLDRPTDRVWLSDPAQAPSLKPIVRQLQDHFDTCISPLSDLLLDVADSNASKANFIKQDHVCQDLVAAMLSPLDTIHNAALTVVREAYDSTYSREQCFRRLLLYHPLATIDGIQKTTAAFASSAARLPDACSGAMRMARCLGSVLDALCSSEDGLLRDDSWLDNSGVRTSLPLLWDALCETSAKIYENTSSWAIYHENDRMTVWMRDAIIFGNSLADELRSFEAAASGKHVGESPQKMSNIGHRLVGKAMAPVDALMAWLRLNDSDLFRSTVNLLVKFFSRFAKVSVPLSDNTLRRIRRYATGNSTRTLDKAEIFRLVLVLQKHPLHRVEFEGLVEPEEIELKRKAAKSRPAPTEIEDDEDEDDEVSLVKNTSRLDFSQPPTKAKSQSSTSQLKQTTLPKKPQATVADLLKKAPSSKPQAGSSSSTPSAADTKKPQKKETSSKSLIIKSKTAQARAAPQPPRQTFSHAALRKMQNSLSSDESSSDDDDDEDEDGPKGLASITNPINKKPRLEVNKRQVKPMAQPQPLLASKTLTSKTNRNLSEARKAENAARLRAPPDFTSLHRNMLQWVSHFSLACWSCSETHVRVPGN